MVYRAEEVGSEPLEYPLHEFENGNVHVRLQINGVENTVSEIYIQ